MAISRISDRKQSLRTFSGVQKGSVYFDGSGDYITTPSAGAFQLEKDFTIECWVYPLSFSGSPSIWCAGTETTNRFITALNTSGQITTNLYSGSTTTYSGIIPANQWTHLAWVRYGSTFRLFINGTASTTTETQTGTFGNGTFRIGADASGATGFLGYISNFRIVKDIAVYFGNFISPTAPLSFDTNSASGFFNGTSNYLDMATTNNTNFDWIAGNTTIETWIFPTSVSGYKSIISKNNISTNNDWDLALDSTGKLNWFYWRGSSQVLTSTTAVTLNTWSHVAFVYNRSSQQINLFINGANTAGAAYSPTRDLGSSSLKIGASYAGMVGSTTAYFSGYMSQFRIVQNNLPVLYSSNFTPSLVPLTSIPGTKLLTLQSSTIKDNSPSALRIETNVPVTGLSATSDGYYSHYFDGTGDYLTIPNNPAFNVGSENFTIEFWFYTTNLVANWYIFGKGDAATVAGSSFSFANLGTTWQIYYNTSSTLSLTQPVFTTNQWTHIAVVRNSTTVTVYKDGVSASTGNIGAGVVNATASPVYVGGYAALTPFSGYISNFRLVKGTAVYTSTFTPPTAPLTAISGTSLLTCQSNRFIDNSTNAFTVTKVGDTKISTLQPFGGSNLTKYSSAYYGTKTDYLGIRPQPGLVTFSSDFTFECWVYPSDATLTTWGVWDSRQASTNANPMVIRLSPLASPVSGSYRMEYYNGTAYFGTTTIYTNQWTYLALVRSGTTMTFYVNGVAGGTATVSGTQTGALTSGLIYIGTKDGSISAYGNLGYIADFRITNGYARYTTTFTPPTVPLVGF